MVEALLDRNRDDIWERRVPSLTANARLARSLLSLFLGVFLAYVLAVQAAPFARIEALFGTQLGGFASGSLRDVHFGTTGELATRNGAVMVVCFVTAILYRHGGMLLVLAWNASRWGVIFSWVARAGADDGSAVGSLARTLGCTLPHLTLEATAYILVARPPHGHPGRRAQSARPPSLAPLRPSTSLTPRLRVLGAGGLLFLGATPADDALYPDVLVTCSDREEHPRWVRHPTLVAAVLSETTAAYDRGLKFERYRTLDTLHEYLLIDPERPAADLYRRGPDGIWSLHPARGADTLALASLDVTIPLAALCEGVDAD